MEMDQENSNHIELQQLHMALDATHSGTSVVVVVPADTQQPEPTTLSQDKQTNHNNHESSLVGPQ